MQENQYEKIRVLFFKLIEKNQETKLRCSPLDSYSISLMKNYLEHPITRLIIFDSSQSLLATLSLYAAISTIL